ncbi:histone H3 lysine 36 (K36) methyltransferase [Metarhizium album ARSEF 1941]|uniref:Histone-lysine N-methyltransferase, H3 lysine-36 specific n=1 Tax=Metarhizium album (strain ARSEF 1941) TaxID=1081103 RepID=A0A0B2WX29_METAS|nr:histone H3 lysine 36 (K36) methyltransferase [Metarhizium album ARSEF 1941]KHO00757.1 histone H3 lysine 36 (K36) methyltransferase [Metarhizium album ARSEF 1941]
MEDEEHASRGMSRIKLEDGTANGRPEAMDMPESTPTHVVKGGASPASVNGIKSESDGVNTPASGKPRLSRRSSQKPAEPEPRLFNHLPDVTDESCKSFQVIRDCLYGSRHLGSTDNDALDCDCAEEFQDGENFACGEDSDCINRATKMECVASGSNCGGGCQNQRFQRKLWADVAVIKTDKKGYGLRTDSPLQPNDFIYEYVGEVINEPTFRRRMLQYDNEGIKHFYFMSLSKSEFVDATRKGNLGRFCNHSCNPNCYVDKWVVGDKLRMGIFALRKIQAGEELVFNYNVDRYGAEPQPCYCGELNCVGFIGGKTQTERATKLPATVVEALGIDDADGWDKAVAKKPRRKRPEEDDEEYVNSLPARSLGEDDSRKVMAALVQCKEKWIAVKLLERIQRSDDDRVIHSVMRMHAYQILKTTLNTFIDDHNVVLQVLDILDKFPRMTRNKIQDSNIEATIQPLTDSKHEDVSAKSKKLLDDWSKLEVAYRIRRRKVDPNAPVQNLFDDRRGQAREEETAQSTPKTASPRPIDAPKGPKSSIPQRSVSFQHNNVNRPPRRFGPLPEGWFTAKDSKGHTYYYNKQGKTTWSRPTQPANDGPKAPSKAIQEQLAIQSIIDRVTKEGAPKHTLPQPTPSHASESSSKESRRSKWKALPMEKQMKIYENTVFPPVKHMLDKFRHRLPKAELKRLGRDIAKKLVASDYKNNRVDDPTAALSEKQTLKIKKYVKDFLTRAVEKYDVHQRKQASKEAKPGSSNDGAATTASDPSQSVEAEVAADDIALSDMEENENDSPSSQERKRKRDSDVADSAGATPSEGPELKRPRAEDGAEPSPPPPPPPPPDSGSDDALTEEHNAEQRALKEQEEALMRENEEAQRLEDEANMSKNMGEKAEEMRKDIVLAA